MEYDVLGWSVDIELLGITAPAKFTSKTLQAAEQKIRAKRFDKVSSQLARGYRNRGGGHVKFYGRRCYTSAKYTKNWIPGAKAQYLPTNQPDRFKRSRSINLLH